MSRSRLAATSTALAVGGLAVFGLQTPALAQSADCGAYPSDPCPEQATVSDNSVQPGQVVTLTGQGFQAGSPIQVTLTPGGQVLGNTTANADGKFSIQITIPSDLSPGSYTLNSTGVGADGESLTLQTPITVEGSGGGGGGGGGTDNNGGALPRTGTEVTLVAVTGIALVGVGTAAVVAGRRRRLQPA